MRNGLVSLALVVSLGVAAPSRAQSDPEQAPAASGAGSAESSAPDNVESARAHFRLGVDFYRERNFRAALIEFQRAYDDAPHYKLLYNLGQASLELQEYAGAIDYLTAYLEQGGDEIPEERRREVEETIRYLESRIARVSIASNQDGADVYIDDTHVGRTPLGEPLRVGAGRHKFTAVKQGFPQIERTLDIAAQEEREVRLDFIERRPVVASPLPAPPPVVVHESDGASGSAALLAGMTTAMLGAGAITMTVLAVLAEKNYQDELQSETTRARLDELSEDAETKALITDIAWGATLAAGVVTAVLLFSDDDEREATARAARGVAVGVGPSGIVVDGRF